MNPLNIHIAYWGVGNNFGDDYLALSLRKYISERFPRAVIAPTSLELKEITPTSQDVVVIAGGGVWGPSMTGRLSEDLFHAWRDTLAHLVVANIGIESFSGDSASQLDVLAQKAEFISFRDHVSYSIACDACPQHSRKFLHTSDTTFLKPLRVDRNAVESEIAFNLCGPEKERYTRDYDIDKVISGLRTIQTRYGHKWSGVVFSHDSLVSDYKYCRQIDGQCPPTVDLSPYSRCMLCVGMSFHAVVLALQNRIPVIAIAYSNKVARLMQEYDLMEFCIDPQAEGFTETADRLVHDCCAAGNRYPIDRIERGNAASFERMGRFSRLFDEVLSSTEVSLNPTTSRTGIHAQDVGTPQEALADVSKDQEGVCPSCDPPGRSSRAPVRVRSGGLAVTRVKPSIVLPTYNHLKYLPLAIESVLAQTHADFELIIVNDGSTDGTREFLDRLVEPRIKVIHQENARLPSALNAGFKAASGELLTWISADNWCAPTFLETLIGALTAYPDAGFASSGYACIDGAGNVIQIHRNPDYSLHSLMSANPGTTSFMYRRECHDVLGYYDADLEGAEDWDMWLRIHERYKSVYVPDVIYYYRYHADSMTVQKQEQISEASRKTIAKMYDRNKNVFDICRVYPEILQCRDQSTAAVEACFDFGTALLRSPFNPADAAIKCFELALTSSPRNAGVASNLAIAHGMAGRYDDAERVVLAYGTRVPGGLRDERLRRLLAASRQKDQAEFKEMPLRVVDKTRSELFKIEAMTRLVYSHDSGEAHR